MATLSKKQKREKKKSKDKKIQREMQYQKNQSEIKDEASKRIQDELILTKKKNEETMRHQQELAGQKTNTKMTVNYIADRNGCGYFRCIWPSELLATYKNMMSLNSFIYHFEQSILSTAGTFRFQRQATDSQLQAWETYRTLRRQYGYQYKLQYEIDDLLMEIEPTNKIAYDYFDAKKKSNHMQMLHTSDSITFSTDALKDIYVDLIPNQSFIQWMEEHGKLGSQNKFPRVMKNENLEDWKLFVNQSVSQY